MKPFVKSNKNDFVDAEVIAEAVEYKSIRFVPLKTDGQLDLQAIHCVRDRLVSRCTAVINQIRAFYWTWHGLCAEAGEAEGCDGRCSRERGQRADTDNAQPDWHLWDEWKTVKQQVEELADKLDRSQQAMQVAAGSGRSQALAQLLRRLLNDQLTCKDRHAA